jgi:hypothetical protein
VYSQREREREREKEKEKERDFRANFVNQTGFPKSIYNVCMVK